MLNYVYQIACDNLWPVVIDTQFNLENLPQLWLSITYSMIMNWCIAWWSFRRLIINACVIDLSLTKNPNGFATRVLNENKIESYREVTRFQTPSLWLHNINSIRKVLSVCMIGINIYINRTLAKGYLKNTRTQIYSSNWWMGTLLSRRLRKNIDIMEPFHNAKRASVIPHV